LISVKLKFKKQKSAGKKLAISYLYKILKNKEFAVVNSNKLLQLCFILN